MTLESIAIVAGLAVIVISTAGYVRAQRGGPGPTVGHVARILRPFTNAWFGIMNWPIPFDRNGELIPIDERRRTGES